LVVSVEVEIDEDVDVSIRGGALSSPRSTPSDPHLSISEEARFRVACPRTIETIDRAQERIFESETDELFSSLDADGEKVNSAFSFIRFFRFEYW